MAAYQLSREDRDLCDKFEALMQKAKRNGVTCLSVSHGIGHISAAAHNSCEAFTSDYESGKRLSDKIQTALNRHGAANLWTVPELKQAYDLICKIEEACSNKGNNDAYPLLYDAARLIEKADDELRGVKL